MTSRIKGITVEIGGDTTRLEKALKQVNSTIKTTQSELKDVERVVVHDAPQSRIKKKCPDRCGNGSDASFRERL